MTQLSEQLINSNNIPMLGPLGPNINFMNQMPLPQMIQTPQQPNIQYQNNIQNISQKPMAPSKMISEDGSKKIFFLIFF